MAYLGVCANVSTDSWLLQLTDFILRGMGKGFYTRMILVDLQKAFDTLDHTLLLRKMECIGFKNSVIKWFQSYLSNRKCFVTLDNVFSDVGLINCGVPQGSILKAAPFPNINLLWRFTQKHTNAETSYLYLTKDIVESGNKKKRGIPEGNRRD